MQYIDDKSSSIIRKDAKRVISGFEFMLSSDNTLV